MAESSGAANGSQPNGISARHKPEESAVRKRDPSSFATSSSSVFFIGLFVTSVTVAFGLGCIAQIFVARRLAQTTVQWDLLSSLPILSKMSRNDSSTVSLDGKDQQRDTLSPKSASSQHLLMDVRNVEHELLRSEARLLRSVERSVRESSLKKLSSFCHSKTSTTTCVIALEEGNVVFRAWPHRGVILLDIFLRNTRDSTQVFPQLLERSFSLAKEHRNDGGIAGGAISHVARRRGLSQTSKEVNDEEEEAGTDSHRCTLDKDAERPFCKGMDSKVAEGDSRLGRPGILSYIVASKTATSVGEAYHEALVHPGMLVHSNPSRVAMLEMDDRSIIREVLKHRTVKVLKVLSSYQEEGTTEGRPNEETDADDCPAASPFMYVDDDRVAISYRTSTGGHITAGVLTEEGPFDVVIANALEQWDDCEHIEGAYNGLSDDGVLITPFGNSPFYRDNADGEVEEARSYIMDCVKGSGFGSAHVYEEAHSSLDRPQLFLVACKDINCREEWYANEAENNWEIQKRVMRTDSGLIDLKHFDGAIMGGYQRPPKAVETMFCRRNPDTLECKKMIGYDPLIPNVYVDKFEVKNSTTGENSGRGLFTTVDIAKGSYIFQDIEVHTVQFYPLTNELVQNTLARYPEANELKSLYSYMEGYGYESDILGGIGSFVDSSIATFMNHGCNGTFNYGSVIRSCNTGGFASEYVADPNSMPQCEDETTSFNPVVDRRLEHQWSSFDGALKDIAQGEELFTNYLLFTSKEEDWYDTVIELQGLCSGKLIGLVAQIDQTLHDTEGHVGSASAQ